MTTPIPTTPPNDSDRLLGEPGEPGERHDVLPAATPAWITPELIRHTLAVWQPRYPRKLSLRDAVELIVTVGRLFGVLREGVPHEAIRCPGPGLVT